MLPRVVEGYKRLLKVAEAAKVFEKNPEDKFKRNILWHMLDALEAPVPETEEVK